MNNGNLLFELSNICKDVILSQRCQESVKREVSLINLYVLKNNIFITNKNAVYLYAMWELKFHLYLASK